MIDAYVHADRPLGYPDRDRDAMTGFLGAIEPDDGLSSEVTLPERAHLTVVPVRGAAGNHEVHVIPLANLFDKRAKRHVRLKPVSDQSVHFLSLDEVVRHLVTDEEEITLPPALLPAVDCGVASGDVTSTSAILWARVGGRTSVKVEVWDNPSLTGQKVFQSTEPQTSSAGDFTVKIEATGLQPDTTYCTRLGPAG